MCSAVFLVIGTYVFGSLDLAHVKINFVNVKIYLSGEKDLLHGTGKENNKTRW